MMKDHCQPIESALDYQHSGRLFQCFGTQAPAAKPWLNNSFIYECQMKGSMAADLPDQLNSKHAKGVHRIHTARPQQQYCCTGAMFVGQATIRL